MREQEREPAVGPNRLVRRIDWRFLMDDPALGRVAYRGPDPGRLLSSLRQEADSARSLPAADRDGTARPDRPDVDLVVLRQPDGRDLRDARRALAAGGRLYCEVDRRAGIAELLGRPADPSTDVPAGALLPGDGTGLLREEGFADVRLQAHYPSFDRCREIVPLEPAAVSLALRRHLPWLPEPLLRAGTAVAVRALPGLAPFVSLLARPAPDAAPRPAIRGSDTRARPETAGLPWAGLPPGRRSRLAVTPRFRASKHVVVLLPDRSGRRAESVVKVARASDRSEALVREADNLRKLEAARAGGFDSVPRLRSTGRVGGLPFLVETGLGGRPMNRTHVRRHPASSIRAVTAWLADLHRSTARRGREPGDLHERLVARPLERLAASLDLDGPVRRLLAETRRRARPLEGCAWPTVFEHGDLSQPNLLLDPSRGVGVVDWELANPEGMPAVDLFFFLAYAGFARHRASTPSECVRAFDRTFFRPAPRVEDAVESYASQLRLPRGLLSALFAACWPRQVLGLLDRTAVTASDGSRGPEAGASRWIRRHRFFAVWKHTVDEFERLRIGGGTRA